MSQLIACLILMLILAVNSELGVNMNVNYAILKHDHHPNKCSVETSRGQLLVNSNQIVRYPDKCASIYCGYNSWALIYECASKSPPEGCEFGDYTNFKADFPDCCQRTLECNLA